MLSLVEKNQLHTENINPVTERSIYSFQVLLFADISHLTEAALSRADNSLAQQKYGMLHWENARALPTISNGTIFQTRLIY